MYERKKDRERESERDRERARERMNRNFIKYKVLNEENFAN